MFAFRAQAFFGVPDQALVHLLHERMPELCALEVRRIASHLQMLCQTYNFAVTTILSLIEIESHFEPHRYSAKGAIGLMQIRLPTARFAARLALPAASPASAQRSGKSGGPVCNERALQDPVLNLSLGIAYLAYLRKHYPKSAFHMFAAYQVGPGRLDRWLRGPKPFRPNRTRAYFARIKRTERQFAHLGANHPLVCRLK